MPAPKRGLYELLITAALEARLARVDERLVVSRDSLRHAEVSDRIALHLSRVVRRTLDSVDDSDRVAKAVALARTLLKEVDGSIGGTSAGLDSPLEPGEVLRSIAARLPDGTTELIRNPLTPLLDTTLLTNAPGEPRIGNQIETEIQSADRIDVVMAFIRRTGIRSLLDALRDAIIRGTRVRVLTTSYTGSTEAAALDVLRDIGAEVRVSYDTTGTRLHAKAWLFHRDSGFSTAYIGSSNLTHSAQISGLEWNVRVSGARNPDVIAKVSAVFDSYWSSDDFVPYERDEFLAHVDVSTHERSSVALSPLEVRLYPFQERLLELIALARQAGRHRNLLVSATGTGKTVMAAVDYARLRESLPRARMLFVAHREEILTQSRATFQHCIRDAAFGELWVGGQRPKRFEHVFASIQSLAAADLKNLDPTHFDVVIVDEFHRAAARSYRALLEHVRPLELLGMTATPERSDGLPVLDWFDGRIAAELRLWDAIDQHRLTPFVYYGVHDQVDLREVPWRRGQGYDVNGLTNLLTGNDVWARLVLKNLHERVDDVARMRALGFCVSIAHARFMARVFKDAGVAATAVWADTPDDERRKALGDLAARRCNIVFSVDLFSEGVDLPAVDTLLLLRPTDSPTLFLQQLGRGLRKCEGKTVCTVLDFVGRHRGEFRFDRRFGALFGVGRKELAAQIEERFPLLPAGCQMELDPIAADIVLRSIREAVPSKWSVKVEELRRISSGNPSVRLAAFLEASDLDLDDVYTGDKSWSDLRSDARLPVLEPGPNESTLRRAVGRLLHIDDAVRMATYQRFLSSTVAPDPSRLAVRERRLLRMLVASVADKAVAPATTLEHGCELLWEHPQVRLEILDLLEVLQARVEHVQHSLTTHVDVPLLVHARYTRIEILGAFGIGTGAKISPWQSGVYWAEDARSDLFAFTLDKTSGRFSPTTRYRDFAISRELIHWESQSTTRAESETGRRYQEHVERGSSVMMFARLRDDERAFWFLGPATFQGYEGELPMAVTWRLEHPLPGDLYTAFAVAVG